MAFNFATPPADYMLRAQAGLSLDPSVSGDAVAAQAAQGMGQRQSAGQAMPAGQPAGQGPLPDIPVSKGEALLSWLAHGGTPAEAAQQARAIKLENLKAAYSLQQSQMLMEALRSATPQQRQAILFNAPKYGEAVSSNFALHDTPEGATETMFGGSTQPGGYSGVAPKLMVGPAGQPIALTQTGAVPLGPQLAGKKTAANGVVTDENLGVVGNYATPQTVAGQIYPFQAGATPGATAPPTVNGMVASPSAPQPSAMAGVTAATARATPFDAKGFIRSFILPHEGGLNPRDMNGAPSKYGINGKANPGVDVPNLTADQAADIYLNKYVPMSGAASLPPALAAVHLDTAVINPARAKQFLRESGGDASKYLALRQSWMDRMVATNPRAAPYEHAWNQRNADLATLIAQSGAAATPQQAEQPAGGLPTAIGAPIGRTGRPISGEGRAQAGIPANDTRPYVYDEQGLPKLLTPEYGPEAKAGMRNSVLTSDEYKQAAASSAAYRAMVGNARTMTGPAAYAMLDTFARAINPGAVARPQVIETIEKNLGLPAQLVGALQSKFGAGNLPTGVRQQIIDAVIPFAQAHWDQAAALNAANTELARQHGFSASDVTAPLEARPSRVSVAALEAGIPPPSERKVGQVYATPRGQMRWAADGWHPAGGR